MKDGVRVLNVARGPLLVDDDLKAALDSGKVAGAALDVFREEPITDHPLFGYPNVVVTPHLGASTAEATDRAGYQAAEQVVAALTGGVVTSAVNVPAVAGRGLEALGPFLPLAAQPRADRRGARPRAPRSTASRSSTCGRIAERDTRLLTVQVLKGVLAGHTEEEVNDVNAPSLAEERGIAIVRDAASRGARLHRPRARDGRQRRRRARAWSAPTLGSRDRPHLLEAWGSRFNVQLEEHLAVFRYRDQPGMIGRVGTALGEAGVNIVSAAVGRQPEDDDDGEAVMVVTADVTGAAGRGRRDRRRDGFVAGRTVSL